MHNTNLPYEKHFMKITQDDLKKILENESSPLLVDLRTPTEFSQGHIMKSKNIPIEVFKKVILKMNLDLKSPIILYCRSGRKSGIAASILYNLGFRKIYNLGGINNWIYDLEK
ncbi:rhodanese-like domain-containing protein [Clostridium tyrobutyricum]|uniref:rhodanese-like domain-containing protein n=1 Tax=Clostridium tyrobutyricum TaxID=1519 RepID=UPI001C3E6C60|nr:rhodanese-like domain-containing protein [Clostridium tyrobutyricum]MBV4436159.1 rhodanese-like domain-containing protein [Clostridium tyrobutyricum]